MTSRFRVRRGSVEIPMAEVNEQSMDPDGAANGLTFNADSVLSDGFLPDCATGEISSVDAGAIPPSSLPECHVTANQDESTQVSELYASAGCLPRAAEDQPVLKSVTTMTCDSVEEANKVGHPRRNSQSELMVKLIRRPSARMVTRRSTKTFEPDQPVQAAQTDESIDQPRSLKSLEKPKLLNENGSMKKNVLVINTGGTIGMQDLGEGSLGPVPGALLTSLAGITELQTKRMPRCYFLEFDPIMDSADMTPDDWTFIAKVIHQQYYDYDGFCVLHGTDTMAYTASALSFMFEQLAKPVVLTGAQLPIFEPVSDARQNFIGSVLFAGLSDVSEVCIFFNGNLLRGNRSSKCNARALNAFETRSFPVLAEVGAPTQIYKNRLMPMARGLFRMHQMSRSEDCKVLVVWTIPGSSKKWLESLRGTHSMKGIILCMYGTGSTLAKSANLVQALREFGRDGVVIAAVSQTTSGPVQLGESAVGREYKDAGVVACHDMTVEAAVTKMAYLFSKGLPPCRVRQLMQQDLRGEITTEITAFAINEPVSGLASL